MDYTDKRVEAFIEKERAKSVGGEMPPLLPVGNTPLIRLWRILSKSSIQLFAKMEMCNPGGSIKDRPARNIVKGAWQRGEIDMRSTIIESSSGNLGVGLAQICQSIGLPFICIVDSNITPSNLRVLQALGARIEMIDQTVDQSVDLLKARIERAKFLTARIPGSYWCNQYANPDNWKAHHQTMSEIVNAMNGQVDYLFCCTSSCGTLRGCVDYLRRQKLSTKVVAIDAEGSVVFGGKGRRRLIPGLGASRVPENWAPDLADDFVRVSDRDCVIGCRTLLNREGILAGGSSGGLMVGIERYTSVIPKGSRCAAILPDRGDRYLDTIYADEWVRSHFGDGAIKSNGRANAGLTAISQGN